MLDQGKLIEVGSPSELLAKGGAYARLHREQFEEQPAEVLDLATKRASR